MERFELAVDSGELVPIEVARDYSSRRIGFSRRENIDGGMLFVFPFLGNHRMWMRDTYHPLDMLFLDQQGYVLDIETAEPESDELIGIDEPLNMCLKFPKGFQKCMTLPLVTNFLFLKSINKHLTRGQKIQLCCLTSRETLNGNPGGERVFSQESTKTIVDSSQAAENEEDLIELGKTVAEEISKQDDRGNQYVEPDKTMYAYGKEGAVIENEADLLMKAALQTEHQGLKKVEEAIYDISKVLESFEIPKPDTSFFEKNLDALKKDLLEIRKTVDGSSAKLPGVIKELNALTRQVIKEREALAKTLKQLESNNSIQTIKSELNEIRDYLKASTQAEWELDIERDKQNQIKKIKGKRLK